MELKGILSQMADYTTDAIVITKAVAASRVEGPEIVYVNKSFTTLTGYTAQEAIGRTPKFLQGIKTDRKTLARMAQSIEDQKSVCVEVLNYTSTHE